MLKKVLTAVTVASIVTIGFVGTVTISSESAFAKRKGEAPVSNSTAAEMFGSCMVTLGHVLKSGKTYDRCCSKQLGFCIKCPKRGGTCVKSPYRIINPTSGNNNVPGSDVLAPTPDKTGPSRPGTAPKLQLQKQFQKQ